jgi:ferredoxin
MNGFRYLDDVATLRLDESACVGCGVCETVCPHGVLVVTDRKARILDRGLCMECGGCARNCPVEALSVHAGVGCAIAIIKGWLTGSEPDCGSGSGCC